MFLYVHLYIISDFALLTNRKFTCLFLIVSVHQTPWLSEKFASDKEWLFQVTHQNLLLDKERTRLIM